MKNNNNNNNNNNNVVTYDVKNPYLAKIVVNRELHQQGSDRSCRHVEVEVPDDIKYEPGDHINVFAQNDPEIVTQLAKRLNLDLNQVVEIRQRDNSSQTPRTPKDMIIVAPVTLRALFMQYFDLQSIPRKPILKVLAGYATNETEKEKLLKISSDDPADSSTPNEEHYNTFVQEKGRTILEILELFESVKPPLDHFLEVLPKLQARSYSISSSPLEHKNRIHITAVLVDFKTPSGRRHVGTCTGWFMRNTLKNPEDTIEVPIYIHKSHFKMPEEITIPLVMVGPGTGLAPFRGFLFHRKHLIKQISENKEKSENIQASLFFGCRYHTIDCIYKEELEEFQKNGTITDLQFAFSREQEKKIYVQHKIAEPEVSKRIFNMFEKRRLLLYLW